MASRTGIEQGTVVGGYEVERLLGRGGMSTVYVARDVRLGRHVALKVIAAELAGDGRFVERFRRESRLAAALEHPAVVPVYEAGDDEGVFFIAMRLVGGSDLRTLLHEGGRVGVDGRLFRCRVKRPAASVCTDGFGDHAPNLWQPAGVSCGFSPDVGLWRSVHGSRAVMTGS